IALRDPAPFPTRRSSDLASSGALGAGSTEQVVTVAAADADAYQAIVAVVRNEFWVVRATRAVPGAGATAAPDRSGADTPSTSTRSEEHTSELQSRENLVC